MKSTLKAMIGIMLAAAITVILEQYFESTNLFKGKKSDKAAATSTTSPSSDAPNPQINTKPVATNMEDENEEDGNDETEETTTTDEVEIKEVAVNTLLRLDQPISLKNNQETLLWRIDNKKEPKKTSYLKNINCPSFIPNYKDFIDIQFDFTDDDMVNVIAYLSIESYNKSLKKWQRNFFQPRKGTNKLRLPNKFPTIKKQEIRFGYILNKDIEKSSVPFYHTACSCGIE